jgi:hypothetical protein
MHELGEVRGVAGGPCKSNDYRRGLSITVLELDMNSISGERSFGEIAVQPGEPFLDYCAQQSRRFDFKVKKYSIPIRFPRLVSPANLTMASDCAIQLL